MTPSWLSGSWRPFLYSSSVYCCHLFLVSSASVRSISVLYRTHLCMKCSLGISNFLEEISSLSHSVVFLYFFALITEEGFLILPCYSLELCIQMEISFPFSFAFHFSSLLSYLYMQVRKQQLELDMEQQTDCFQIGKWVREVCILSLCLFNLYAEYIMRSTGLDGAQARMNIARRNINHLRHADNTTLMAESEDLKSLLMKVKEESETLA